MKKAELVALLLEQFSGEDGLNCNTGSRLTMRPMAGPMPRRKQHAPSPRRTAKPAARAAKA